jgi:abequosyltransferase
MRLSICIPTYNRADYIGTLLDSIAAEGDLGREVEIVISDNASIDGTGEVIERYRQALPNIRYFRSDMNLGADRNFLRVIELATGDYCWLMGDDDIVEPGAIARIAKALQEHPGIAGLSVYRNAYTADLSQRLVERPVAGGAVPVDVLLHGADHIFSTLAEYICFISAQVVDRRLWQEVAQGEDLSPYFNAYVHVYVIGRMLQKRPQWYYIADPCVGWRSGNDSFMADGALKRMLIDVYGMEQITGDLFGRRSSTYRRVNGTTASVQVRYGITGAKLARFPLSFFLKATPILMRHYWSYPGFWRNTVPVLLTPGIALRTARWLYRKTLKRRGSTPLQAA